MQMFKTLNKRTFITNYILYALLFSVSSYLYLLDTFYILMLLILLLFTIPIHLYCEFKFQKEKKRFDEYILYLNYMVMHYKISGKIRKALIETMPLYAESSTMYILIQQAIENINKGTGLKQSLLPLELEYNNSYIKQVHDYMILGESEVGTGVYEALSQVNFKSWQVNVEILQSEKIKIKQNNFKYALTALLTGYLPLPFLSDYVDHIRTVGSYQVVTFLYFVAFIAIYAFIPFILVNKWIDERE